MRRLAKSYGRHSVLQDVSFLLQAGEILGLVGLNGSGKTTLLRILAGLVRPDAGAARWVGKRSPTAAALVYFGGGDTLPPSLTAKRWATLFDVEESVERCNGRRVGRMSRGSRQRVGLSVAFARDPLSTLLLDEPWEGLDPVSGEWLTGSLRERVRGGYGSVIVSSHRLHDLVTVANRFVVLANGAAIIWAPSQASGMAETVGALRGLMTQVRGVT